MRLQAQPPARMIEAISDRRHSIGDKLFAIHRLQIKMREIEAREILWPNPLLRKNQLELGAGSGNERRVCFWADTNPVEPFGGHQRAIGLDRGFESARMDRTDQGRVKLQQGLAAGENNKAVFRACRPGAFNRGGKHFRILETTAAIPVRAGEIGIAELANSRRAVLFAAGPEVAAGKAAKDRRPPRLRTLALKGEENFLY